MDSIWKLLVAIFWLVAAAVILLFAYELNSSFLFCVASVLAFIGIGAGLLAIVDHRESEKDKQEE